ncbi:MAG: type II toxin-antitoxin system HicA family toxin [Crenarchaeota archaeon]|nr:type II toxin-antitoxin system HicA family toxin [Thermoproteota archaeon]
MPRLKILGGKDVVKILSRFGFTIISQRGSHVKLRRILPDGTKQSLTIPLHEELDKGTLKAIYRQALRFIPEEELKPHFYD